MPLLPRRSRSLAAALLVWALASCVFPPTYEPMRREEKPPVRPDLPTHGRQLSFGAGLRGFSDEQFGALDDQFAVALDYCEPLGLGALRLEGGMHYSYDDATGTAGGETTHLDAWTFELLVGANLSHQLGRLRPYIGAGVGLLFLDLRAVDEDVDVLFQDGEGTVGFYAKAGLLLQVTPASHVGLEFRHFEGGDVTLDGTEVGTDNDEVLIVLGSSFE